MNALPRTIRTKVAAVAVVLGTMLLGFGITAAPAHAAGTCYDRTVSYALVHNSSTRGYAKAHVNWCTGYKLINGRYVLVITSISRSRSLSSTTSDPIQEEYYLLWSAPATGSTSATWEIHTWNIKENRSLATDYHWSFSGICTLVTITASGSISKGCSTYGY